MHDDRDNIFGGPASDQPNAPVLENAAEIAFSKEKLRMLVQLGWFHSQEIFLQIIRFDKRESSEMMTSKNH